MSGGCCGWGYSSWDCGWHGTAVVYHGGAYYGNSAWHGGYYNGGYHSGYGYNNAYNRTNAENHYNNYKKFNLTDSEMDRYRDRALSLQEGVEKDIVVIDNIRNCTPDHIYSLGH